MQIEKIKIEKIKAANYNPRKMSDEAKKALEESIKKFGLVEPIIVNKRNEEYTIVGGHQRFEAIKNIGAKEIYCVTVSLSLAEEKALNISLNNKKIQGEWDKEKLEIVLGELRLELPEFEEIALEELEFSEGVHHKTSLMYKKEKKIDIQKIAKISIKNGDIIQLGKNKLFCGKSHKKSKPFFMIGFGTTKELKKAISTKPVILYFWIKPKEYLKALPLIDTFKKYSLVSTLFTETSDKNKNKNEYDENFMACLYFVEQDHNHNWQGSRKEKNFIEHTDQENVPLECFLIPIKNNTFKKERVTDIFAGTTLGNAIIASEITDRACYAYEEDLKKCKRIIARWESYTGKEHKKAE